MARSSALWVVATGALLIFSLVIALWIGGLDSRRHAVLADAADTIRLEAVLANLWLERILGGHPTETIEQVWEHLDRSVWYAEAMLEGGETVTGRITPPAEAELRREIETVLEEIALFRAAAEARWMASRELGVVEVSPRQLDEAFARLQSAAEDVEAASDAAMAADLRKFGALQAVLILFSIGLAVVTGTVFRRFERARAHDRLALATSERRLRLVLDSTAEGIFKQDLHGNCVFANAACARMLGYDDPEDLIGRSMHELIHRTRADGTPCSKSDCQLSQAILAGEEISADDEVFWRRDCGSFPVEYWSHPIRGEDGEIGAVVTFFDITERLRADEEKTELEGLLRQAQKMEAVGRLAGGVAHDFNNMLSVILGHAEMLLADTDLDRRHRAAIDEIEKAGRESSGFVRQLLAFSRRQNLQPEVLNINPVVEGMQGMIRRMIGEDIELELCLAEDLDNVVADSTQIGQIIMNLIVNARDAMPDGGMLTLETANVILDAEYAALKVGVAPGPHVVLALTDTGHGMDEATRSRLFEPYFTTKERGKGTGLGLATIYGIVKQSGGNIWCYSEPGRGTTFKVYLPSTEAAVEPKVERAAERTRGTAHARVLLVEDEPALAPVFMQMLGQLECSPIFAQNGEEALRLIEDQGLEIDLLLTDVVLPGMSGLALYRRLHEIRPDLRVLYMSGYTDNAIANEGVLDPDVVFLQKPFSMADLAAKLEEALTHSND